jgi:hypothetical protein
MSGVMRNAMKWLMFPVTLIYVRPTLNELEVTSLPAASVTFGSFWSV